MIFGDTVILMSFWEYKSIYNRNILSKYEIITVRQDYLSGCFTLFKNEHKTNTLFMQSKNYLKVFYLKKTFALTKQTLLLMNLQNQKMHII